MELSSQDSARMRDISFVAICCVVFQHFCLLSGYQSTDRCFFSEVIWRGILDWPVSWFFVISGFFLARQYDGSFLWWRNAVLKRVRTLFVPYVIWNLLGAFVMWFYGREFTFSCILSDLGMTKPFPVVAPLWYVRNLLVFCFFSPVIILACKFLTGSRWGIWLAYAMVLCVIVAPCPAKRLCVMPITCFSIGAMISFAKNIPSVNQWLILGCLCTVIGAIAVNSLVFRIGLPAMRFALNFLVIINAWAFRNKIFGQGHINQHLAENAFFIYCLHGIIMLPIYNSHALLKCTHSHFVGIVIWFMVASGTIVFTVVSARCIKLGCPKVFKILTGGRG